MNIIKTERLILRPWKKGDEEPYALINADRRVMEFFPSTLTKEESDQMILRMQKKMEERGWGLWAVTTTENDQCMGFIGLNDIDKSVLIDQPIEIGWRLAFDAWGRGYATEGAKACLRFGFETLNLDEIVAITAVPNKRSRAVMEKIGMHHDEDRDFDHPKLAFGHPLRRHVLYSLQQSEWGKDS
jgi:3-dehydroquinate dehydratase/shikimate dehydrogenase